MRVNTNLGLPEEKRTVCANCGEHPGTQKWVAEGGALALIHGQYALWCQGCVLRAQIAHAEERVTSLDELRDKLAAWERRVSRSVRRNGAAS